MAKAKPIPIPIYERKKMVTLFMVMIFSLLLAMTAYISNGLLKLWFQVIMIIAQLIILNTILADYYKQ
jgi:hypothetical protein